MVWSEANKLDYLFGLAKNDRLIAEIRAELAATQAESDRGGKAARRFKSLMGWAPERHLCAKLGMQLQRRGPSMTQVTTIGLDLAKRVFQSLPRLSSV